MLFCVHCGEKNDDDAKFCIKCGKAIESFEPSAPVAPAADPAPPAVVSDPVSAPGEDGEEFSTKVVFGSAPIPASTQTSDAPEATGDVGAFSAAVDAKLDEIVQMVSHLEFELSSLSDRFDDKISRNEHEATALKQVSAEVEEYRNGLYEKLIMPFIQDIIEVRNGMQATIARNDASIPADEVAVFSEMLADTLRKHSVEIVESASGDEFLSLKHKVVGKVATDDESLNGRVAEIQGESYLLGERYIAPALVKVYAYEKMEPESESN